MTSPLLTFLEKVDTALDGYVETPAWGLSAEELTQAQQLVHRIGNRFAETELRLAHQADLDDRDAKTAWVRATRQSPRVCRSRLRLAAALGIREPIRAAMARGDVSEEHAAVVIKTLDALPEHLDQAVKDQAQATLIELCAHHDPDQLRRLGRHILTVVAPEIADAEEARRVAKEYAAAMERCRLDLTNRHDGTWTLHGVLPDLHAQILIKLLTALGAPKHQRACDHGPDGPTSPMADGDLGQRRGRAFCEFLERIPTAWVPYSGGVTARVVVSMDLDDLNTKLGEAGVVTVDGTVDLPAWEARRMACEGGIIPTVLGGTSEILDLGRSRRFHNQAQRTAIHLRDRTCRAEACDWPAWMGHVHHPEPWLTGGPTDMTGMSLCPHHHARAHDPTYEMRTGTNGKVSFHRRT